MTATMTRYNHAYGGTATEEAYVPSVVYNYMRASGKGDKVDELRAAVRAARGPGEVWKTRINDNQDAVVYTTTTDHLRLVLINR